MKGKVGFAPSETDFQPLVTSISSSNGARSAESWLKALRRTAKRLPRQRDGRLAGQQRQAALGPINHYYWYRLRREQGEGETHSAPEPLREGRRRELIVISGAAVLRSSDHQTDAQKLLAYLVERRRPEGAGGQRQLRVPAAPGVAPPAGLRPSRASARAR